MKVDLDENGTLVITADTPVESFALTHWFKAWTKKDATLMVQTRTRDEETKLLELGLQIVDPQRPTE